MFMAGSGFMDLALSNPYVPTSQTATPLAVSALENAKAYVDNTFVQVTGKIATADYSSLPGFFYMEEPNRSSGIRVVATSMSGTLAKGITISLTGHMATTSAGEREIDSAAVTVSGAPRCSARWALPTRASAAGIWALPRRAWASTVFRAARGLIT